MNSFTDGFTEEFKDGFMHKVDFNLEAVEMYLIEKYAGFVGVPECCIELETLEDYSTQWDLFCEANDIKHFTADGLGRNSADRFFTFREVARYISYNPVYLHELDSLFKGRDMSPYEFLIVDPDTENAQNRIKAAVDNPDEEFFTLKDPEC